MESQNGGVTVKVGQEWEDADPRFIGRRLEVVEVGTTHAKVRKVNGEPSKRTTKIRLDRFGVRGTTKGYRLVKDVN